MATSEPHDERSAEYRRGRIAWLTGDPEPGVSGVFIGCAVWLVAAVLAFVAIHFLLG